MKQFRLVFLAVCLAALAHPAWADTIQLGSGSGLNYVAVSGANDFDFSFAYGQTRINARDFVPLAINPACPCPLGSTASLDNHLIGSMTGFAVVNGVTYSGVNYVFDFTFNAAGPATVVPPSHGLEPGPAFAFTGTLSGTRGGQSVIAPVNLSGQGTTQFSPDAIPTNQLPVRLIYTFTDPASTPSPTPEPASLFLFASGLAVVCWRHRAVSKTS